MIRLRGLLLTGTIWTMLSPAAFADITPNEFSKQFQSCVAQDASLNKEMDCEQQEIMLQQDVRKRVMAKQYVHAQGNPKLLAALKNEEAKYKDYEDALCGEVLETRLEGADPGPMMDTTNLCSMRLERDHLIDLERSTH